MDVDGECDEGPDEGSELEYRPKHGEGLALVLLERIGHHDRPLRRPEQGGGDPEDGSGKDEEPASVLCLIAIKDGVGTE